MHTTVSLRRPVHRHHPRRLAGLRAQGRGPRLLDARRAGPLRRPVGAAAVAGLGRRRHHASAHRRRIVLDNDFRHPAVTAKEAATADVLTGGTAGGRPRRRLDDGRLREDAHPLRRARRALRAPAGDRARSSKPSSREETAVTFEGKHYQVTGLDAQPKRRPEAAPADHDRRPSEAHALVRGARGGHRQHLHARPPHAGWPARPDLRREGRAG